MTQVRSMAQAYISGSRVGTLLDLFHQIVGSARVPLKGEAWTLDCNVTVDVGDTQLRYSGPQRLSHTFFDIC